MRFTPLAFVLLAALPCTSSPLAAEDFKRETFNDAGFVPAGRTCLECGAHRLDDLLGSASQGGNLLCRLQRAQPFERQEGVTDLDISQTPAQGGEP